MKVERKKPTERKEGSKTECLKEGKKERGEERK